MPVLSAATTLNNKTAAPLLFTENRGQVSRCRRQPAPRYLIYSPQQRHKTFFTATGIHYQFEKAILPEGFERDERQAKGFQKQAELRQQIKTETYRFTLSLQGANPAPKVRREEQNAYTENFYLAQCPAGIIGVPTYSWLVYENVYPGIDWVIYAPTVEGGGARAGLKYDFIVHPGADPSLIRLKVSNAQRVQIDKEGALVMATTLGEVKETAPVSYCGGGKVTTAFVQRADGTIGFATSTYDKNKILVIDPSVTWATYYGGSGDEDGRSGAVGGSGNVYLTCRTTSASGIASGSFQNSNGGSYADVFLAKIDGSTLQGFTSIASGNWNNPSIWSGGIVPTASSVVIINTTVTVTANASCYSLTVTPSGSITVVSGFTLTVLH